MTTLTNVIDEVLLNVEGYGGGEAVIGTLTSSLTAAATTAAITGAAGFRPGIMEIGDELVYVTGISEAGTITSMVRGYRGTTVPAVHQPGTIVRSNPRYPRVSVQRAVNDTINSLYPRVPAVDVFEFTFESSVVRYEMPAAMDGVLAVSFKPTGPSEAWIPVTRWRFDNQDAGATGKALEVFDAQPGQPVRVVYTKPPVALASGETVFTDSGLSDWMRDLVVFGACWRVVSFLDAGRVTTNSASQSLMNGQNRQETGTDLAKYYLGMFMQRLDEVETRFRSEYPAVRHYIV